MKKKKGKNVVNIVWVLTFRQKVNIYFRKEWFYELESDFDGYF